MGERFFVRGDGNRHSGIVDVTPREADRLFFGRRSGFAAGTELTAAATAKLAAKLTTKFAFAKLSRNPAGGSTHHLAAAKLPFALSAHLCRFAVA